MNWEITSVKGKEIFQGSRPEAFRRAIAHLNNLDPAFGVTITEPVVMESDDDRYIEGETIAELISGWFIDGQMFRDDYGNDLETECLMAGATIEYGAPQSNMPLYDEPEEIDGYDHIHKSEFVPDGLHIKRYVFPDESAIITNDIIWDIEGAEPFSWSE